MNTPQDNRLRDVLRQHLSPDALAAICPTDDAADSRNDGGLVAFLRRQSRGLVVIPTAMQVMFGIAMSVTAVAFLKADNIHAEVMLATVFLLLLALAMTWCLWTWMRRHHLATIRHIKRLEVAVALLAQERG